MSAPSNRIEEIRARVDALWHKLAKISRFARRRWPWHRSLWHTAIAQFELEVERARRASGEKGGRA
ncbi:MAG: hypothetical protein ACYCPS_06855 [Candidatus Saccharimonadales bacterium]